MSSYRGSRPGYAVRGRQEPSGVPFVQQNQEFNLQNEEFPALPGDKGGNFNNPMDLSQREQLHSQNVSMGRSSGSNLGATYSSHRPQHTPSTGGLLGHDPRPLSSLNAVSSIGYNQHTQQYQQQHHNQSQNFYMGRSSGSNLGSTYSSHRPQHTPSTGGILGHDPRPLSSLNAVSSIGYGQHTQQYQQQHHNQSQNFYMGGSSGYDQHIQPYQQYHNQPQNFYMGGLNMGATSSSYRPQHTPSTFAPPWSNEPAKSEVEFTVPNCYYAKPPPPLTRASFKSFSKELLFYIFYSMPQDEAQLFAADELYERGWLFHTDLIFWFLRVGEPLVSSAENERGTYDYFDPTTFKIVRNENFVFKHEFVEKRSSFLQH